MRSGPSRASRPGVLSLTCLNLMCQSALVQIKVGDWRLEARRNTTSTTITTNTATTTTTTITITITITITTTITHHRCPNDINGIICCPR
ncbi:hypothetical protein E2C01_044639 [Portunus trituberculatus]|uniref:Secreted protein n=1 Tax=Portunus trituberculatus TaxID=210409 RepID=A0A5B7FZS0_PORTR|nr:hypothetical protein [Portunus trituberculatus]